MTSKLKDYAFEMLILCVQPGTGGNEQQLLSVNLIDGFSSTVSSHSLVDVAANGDLNKSQASHSSLHQIYFEHDDLDLLNNLRPFQERGGGDC